MRRKRYTACFAAQKNVPLHGKPEKGATQTPSASNEELGTDIQSGEKETVQVSEREAGKKKVEGEFRPPRVVHSQHHTTNENTKVSRGV